MFWKFFIYVFFFILFIATAFAQPSLQEIVEANNQGKIVCEDPNPILLSERFYNLSFNSMNNRACVVVPKPATNHLERYQRVFVEYLENEDILTHYEPLPVTYHALELRFEDEFSGLHFLNVEKIGSNYRFAQGVLPNVSLSNDPCISSNTNSFVDFQDALSCRSLLRNYIISFVSVTSFGSTSSYFPGRDGGIGRDSSQSDWLIRQDLATNYYILGLPGRGGRGGSDGSTTTGARGGGGGAGGFGGAMFVAGEPGGFGGQGIDYQISFLGLGGNRFTDLTNPRFPLAGGANVILNVSLISFVSKVNSPHPFIRVDGQQPPNPVDSDSRSDVSSGGAGGTGGSGAGRLHLFVNQFTGNTSQNALISASGGDGARGGHSSSADVLGGSGGGGGGGAPGEIVLISSNSSLLSSVDSSSFFKLESGMGGVAGRVGSSQTTGVASGSVGLPQSREDYFSTNFRVYLSETTFIQGSTFFVNYTQCDDGIDNNFDGLVDWNHPDCWPTGEDRDTLYEHFLRDRSMQLDVQGPITPSQITSTPQQLPSWFDGLSSFGADGVCGNDLFTPFSIQLDHFSLFSTDKNTTSTTFLYQSDNFYDIFQRAAFDLSSELVIQSTCPLDTSLTFSLVFDIDFISPSSSCSSSPQPLSYPSDCSLLNTSTSSQESYRLICQSSGSNQISGTGSCIEDVDFEILPRGFQADVEIIVEATNPHTQCTQYGDHGWVTPNMTDHLRRQWMCAQNLFFDISLGGEFISPVSSNSNFTWRNAEQSNVPFKFHHIYYYDMLSNGEEWFACNADGTVQSNANLVAEGQSFTQATSAGMALSCPALLDIIGPSLFDGSNTCSFSSGSSVPPYNGTIISDDCSIEGGPGFCCQRNQGAVPGVTFTASANLGVDECRSSCYYITSAGTPVPLDNILTNTCDDAFKDLFCEDINPFAEGCISTSFLPSTAENNQFVERSACGPNLVGCLGETNSAPNFQENCDDIRFTQNGDNFRGEFCPGPNAYCLNNEYMISGDLNPGDACCVIPASSGTGVPTACAIAQPPFTEDLCETIGGDYLDDTLSLSHYVCPGSTIGDRCCVGGSWQENYLFYMFQTVKENSSFVCYAQNDRNRFAECCGELGTCFNAAIDSLYGSEPVINRFEQGFYGTGGVLHTVQNFDRYDSDRRKVVNYVQRANIEDGRSLSIEIKRSNSHFSLTDWSDFDFLHFDIAFTLARVDTLSLKDTQGNTCLFEDLNSYLVTGNTTYRWHHAVLPLEECADSDISLSSMSEITLSTSYSRNNLHIVVDDFYLSHDTRRNNVIATVPGGSSGFPIVSLPGASLPRTDPIQNTENLFCTGDFQTWISNLDGPDGDIGFFNETTFMPRETRPQLDEIGEYKYACEARASFGWTGSACCGDDTKRNYQLDTFTSGQSNVMGEYFTDFDAGCFGGNVVQENSRVGTDALNDPSLDGLLYHEQEFHACATSAVTYQFHTRAFSPTDVTNVFLVTNNATAFDVVGSFICDPSGRWVDIDSIPKSRIIASRLYNLTFDANGDSYHHFELRCDAIDDYLDMSPLNRPTNIASTASRTLDFCTLRYQETPTSDMQVLIGLSFTEDQDDYLTSLTQYARSVNWLSSSDDLSALCSSIRPAGRTSRGRTTDNFFSICSRPSSSHMVLALNPDFQILLIGYAPQPVSNYAGLFQSSATTIDYIKHYWNQFISLFRNLFGQPDNNTRRFNMNLTTDAILPFLASDEVDFSTLYMQQRGDKKIRAFVHDEPKIDGSPGVITYYTIEYFNFVTDVQPLAEDFFGDYSYQNTNSSSPGFQDRVFLSLNYMKGPNMQIVQLLEPRRYGLSNDPTLNSISQREKTFTPGFDWRQLAPLLKIDDTVSGTPITAQLGDGVIDYDELCDFDPATGEDIFRFNQNGCWWWNVTHPHGNVICIRSTGLLDHSSCSDTP